MEKSGEAKQTKQQDNSSETDSRLEIDDLLNRESNVILTERHTECQKMMHE